MPLELVVDNTILGVSSTANPSGPSYYARTPRGALVDERGPTGKFYYLFDGLGSVRALTDVNGHTAMTYSYDPYGIQTGGSGTGVLNIWRYAGEYNLDPVGGIYHIGARYYNNGQGSWTQQDPTSHVSSLTQADAYPYAGDDPINATDPAGTTFMMSSGAQNCVTVVSCTISLAIGVLTGDYGTPYIEPFSAGASLPAYYSNAGYAGDLAEAQADEEAYVEAYSEEP